MRNYIAFKKSKKYALRARAHSLLNKHFLAWEIYHENKNKIKENLKSSQIKRNKMIKNIALKVSLFILLRSVRLGKICILKTNRLIKLAFSLEKARCKIS